MEKKQKKKKAITYAICNDLNDMYIMSYSFQIDIDNNININNIDI